jgi:hypothetical protein
MSNKFCYLLFVLSLTLTTCLEPFDTALSNYERLLVVDALVTDENKSYTVILSNSVANLDEPLSYEQNAQVVIEDDLGRIFVLQEDSPGIYKSDNADFVGQVGRTYTLKIRTQNGKEYHSAPCLLHAPSNIDRVYYKVGKDWHKDESDEQNGIHILLDGQGNEPDGNYLRWTYEEDWRFRIAYPTSEIILPNNTAEFIPVENDYCFKSDVSTEVLIHSFKNQVNKQLSEKKISFIPTQLTDKVTVRYTINVKQYSISQEEYDFWNKLKESTEDVGDVFGKQPFSIPSNIHNINDPKEPVLGYFQVAGVSSSRIYINRSDMLESGLDLWSPFNGCPADTFLVDFISFFSPYQIYDELVINGRRQLVDPIYDDSRMNIIGLLLASKRCADCTLTGRLEPPHFWEEE